MMRWNSSHDWSAVSTGFQDIALGELGCCIQIHRRSDAAMQPSTNTRLELAVLAEHRLLDYPTTRRLSSDCRTLASLFRNGYIIGLRDDTLGPWMDRLAFPKTGDESHWLTALAPNVIPFKWMKPNRISRNVRDLQQDSFSLTRLLFNLQDLKPPTGFQRNTAYVGR
jgi:hypothetical protein